MINKQGLVYQIKVRGYLDKRWSDWFAGMTITTMCAEDGLVVTELTGKIVDQSSLRGQLCKLWDLNYTLISVNQIEERREKE